MRNREQAAWWANSKWKCPQDEQRGLGWGEAGRVQRVGFSGGPGFPWRRLWAGVGLGHLPPPRGADLRAGKETPGQMGGVGSPPPTLGC